MITITKKSRTTQLNLLPTRKQRVNMWKESKDDNFKPESSPLRKSPMEKERATIGPSISIKGELSGEEDVVIQGRVEGKKSQARLKRAVDWLKGWESQVDWSDGTRVIFFKKTFEIYGSRFIRSSRSWKRGVTRSPDRASDFYLAM